jgi:hypothetical protein
MPRRAVIGNEFFNDNPEYPVVQLFIKMKDIRQKKNRAQELLTSKGYLDTASEAKEVEELGFLDATKREPSILNNMWTRAHVRRQRRPHGRWARRTSPSYSHISSHS